MDSLNIYIQLFLYSGKKYFFKCQKIKKDDKLIGGIGGKAEGKKSEKENKDLSSLNVPDSEQAKKVDEALDFFNDLTRKIVEDKGATQQDLLDSMDNVRKEVYKKSLEAHPKIND